MTRILAFLECDMYVRNFISSGAFDALMERDDSGICLSEHVSVLKDEVPAHKIKAEYQRNADNVRAVFASNKVSMLALADKSSTFRMKAEMGWMGGYTAYEALLARVTPFRALRDYMAAWIKPNKSVKCIIEEHEPELVIFPITGVEATGYELIRLSEKYGFKTLFLQNGWDNLSSKGVFPLLPTYLGVWGPSSLTHAVNIQGMEAHRCLLMGCSRYEGYFAFEDRRDKIYPEITADPYVLFAGATKQGDELVPLHVLDDVIEEIKFPIQIIYRPHPWREKRKCNDEFEETAFRHVILDGQVSQDYYRNKSTGQESVSARNMPRLDYLAGLLARARFLVAAPTSLMLEAALLDVPCLITALNDGAHGLPPSKQIEEEHFRGADEVPGWFIARNTGEWADRFRIHNADQLREKFRTLLWRFGEEGPNKREYRGVLSNAMRHYLYWDERSYSQRLADAVRGILA